MSPINNNPYWQSRVDMPRKWFWLPKNTEWITIAGANIGKYKQVSIDIPGTYCIIADAIDIDYFQYFANHFGYEVDVNKEVIGQFNTLDDNDVNEYIRLSLKNIPSFNRIKTTENAIQVILYSFGIVAELLYLWTNDYNQNWKEESRSNNQNVRFDIIHTDIETPYYPTPHFNLGINISKTPPSWSNNFDDIIKVFTNIKSINSVMRGISGYFETVKQLPSDPDALGYMLAVRFEGEIKVPKNEIIAYKQY